MLGERGEVLRGPVVAPVGGQQMPHAGTGYRPLPTSC
jgi:hypothetical protein